MGIVRGRGTGSDPKNKFSEKEYVPEEDFVDSENPETRFYRENPKKIVNKVTSPDVGMEFSINPYQGCEHGCIYCYARNSHEYWGFNAGIDFESKILYKENAPELLKSKLESRNWKAIPISLSGNTDCYQPVEKKLKITRKLLEIFLEYRHPVTIITKNALILRDLDILKQLAEHSLISVTFSITTMDPQLRAKMEPRTVTTEKRLNAMKTLVEAGIPCGVMVAPIIPGLTASEIPALLKAAGENGASWAGYTVVRLNGAIGDLFKDWLEHHYPDRKNRILNRIKECHAGNLNDSRLGTRIKGDGVYSNVIRDVFLLNKKRFIKNHSVSLNCGLFSGKSHTRGQLDLFS